MQEFAVIADHRGLALPAGATAAQVGRIDTCGLDRFEQALMFADGDDLVRDCKLDFEGLARLRRKEFLIVDRLAGPAKVACLAQTQSIIPFGPQT